MGEIGISVLKKDGILIWGKVINFCVPGNRPRLKKKAIQQSNCLTTCSTQKFYLQKYSFIALCSSKDNFCTVK